MLKKIVPVLALLAVISCSKDDKTTAVIGKITNPTDHNIEVKFYKAGQVAAADIIKLAKKDTVQLGRGTVAGENVASASFASAHFGAATDSIVVTFDGTNKVTHYYVENPATPYPKHYKLSSTRNIVNGKSYTATVKDGVSTAIYSFTEDDFNFSKP